ncbi:diguanylate cyclase [Pseudodonghicola sp.]|uniref:GGDEF domain-containing protein n=1 Tax=Pseudodonghicola sp. TaxID=1969463 RepID=UPI003A976EBC
MGEITMAGTGSGAHDPARTAPYRAAATLFLVVFAACLFGIWSRPVGFLASLWPANALALGVMLRWPTLARPAGWFAAVMAFLLADLVTGADMGRALLLNLANLISIGIAYAILVRLPEAALRLRQPASLLWIVIAAGCAGAGAGVVGALANPLLFGVDMSDGFIFWWATEVVNYIAFLPVVLSAPSVALLRRRYKTGFGIRKTDLLPAGAAALSCALAFEVGGPGAIALPVLALLWCGLIYPVFITTLFTLGFSVMALLFFSQSAISDMGNQLDQTTLFSVRLGASAVAIAPIMLSILVLHRNELMARLRRQATRDALTGILNRAAFLEDAQVMLRGLKVPEGWPSAAAVLMLDLDQFKAVNDSYGHAAGDEMLREVARRVRASLRPSDLFGRLGGDEFAVILHECTPRQADEVAERIRKAIAATPVQVTAGRAVEITASIGMTPVEAGHHPTLDRLLERADQALYLAKEQGRNQVVITADLTALRRSLGGDLGAGVSVAG